MRCILHVRWAVAAAMLLGTPAFASSSIFACFGGGSATTDPKVSCPAGSIGSSLDSIAFGGSDLVTFLAGGGVTTGQVNFSDISLSKQQDPASNRLLADVYAGKKLGTVAIALYGNGTGGSTAPSFNIVLGNAYVTSWSVGASTGSPLYQSVTLSFTSIIIVNNSTGQKVTWTQ
jgi:hypothetical protein